MTYLCPGENSSCVSGLNINKKYAIGVYFLPMIQIGIVEWNVCKSLGRKKCVYGDLWMCVFEKRVERHFPNLTDWCQLTAQEAIPHAVFSITHKWEVFFPLIHPSLTHTHAHTLTHTPISPGLPSHQLGQKQLLFHIGSHFQLSRTPMVLSVCLLSVCVCVCLCPFCYRGRVGYIYLQQ